MRISQCIKQNVQETSALMNRQPYWLTLSFIVSVIFMNLLANKCVINCKYLAVDAGTLLSWIPFLAMDIVVKKEGLLAANRISVLAFVINFIASIILFLISLLPGTWSASYVPGHESIINNALNTTFGGTWYVVMGSLVAFLTSAFTNNYINHAIGLRMQKDNFFAFACRTYISTAIGQFIDNFIFALIVSKIFFGWTMTQCLMNSVCCAAFELITEIIASPIGYSFCKSK